MRIMFQPDALHHQAPSNHTRHHHTLSGPPEKTSGFNIPNAPTASPHAARRTLHAARCTLHAQLTTTRPQLSVKLSLLPSRHDTASPHSQHRPPARLSSTTAPNAPHLHGPSSPTPRPHQDAASPHTSSYATPDPEAQRINAASPIPPSPHLSPPHLPATSLPPHLSRHISPATSLPPYLSRHISPAISLPPHLSRHIHPCHNHPRPHPCAATSPPGPTRIQRFLHMLPTQPH